MSVHDSIANAFRQLPHPPIHARHQLPSTFTRSQIAQLLIHHPPPLLCATLRHDVKGTTALLNCEVFGLHFPLCAVVDYLGFRVLCMSQLPISRETLRAGTDNAGADMHSDPDLTPLMAQAARKLNLAEHTVKGTQVWYVSVGLRLGALPCVCGDE